MMRRRIFLGKDLDWDAWRGYWSEPSVTSRGFVLLWLLLASIPFVGVFVFFVILFYCFFNSLDRLLGKKKV